MVATNQIKNLEHHTYSWVTNCPGCLSNPLELWEKHRKVRFLSCPKDRSTLYFQLSWLLWVFRISGQLRVLSTLNFLRSTH
jgi:hypothetical protein